MSCDYVGLAGALYRMNIGHQVHMVSGGVVLLSMTAVVLATVYWVTGEKNYRETAEIVAFVGLIFFGLSLFLFGISPNADTVSEYMEMLKNVCQR